jgi:putative polyhydroxyalkanoate system protein
MSEISIRRAHRLPLDQARTLAEQVAAKLQERFDLDYRWRGKVLEFSRAGVEGWLLVAAEEIHIHARLGFLLSFLKPTIEHEIHTYLDGMFSAAEKPARRRRKRRR